MKALFSWLHLQWLNHRLRTLTLDLIVEREELETLESIYCYDGGRELQADLVNQRARVDVLEEEGLALGVEILILEARAHKGG